MQYSGNDKYHICHHLFKIQIKCKWKVDGVLDPFKSLLPPIFRKYKLKLRKLFVLNDDGDFVPRFQQIRRLWSQSAATSGQRLSDCVGSFITLCHHHWLTSIEPILIFVSTVHSGLIVEFKEVKSKENSARQFLLNSFNFFCKSCKKGLIFFVRFAKKWPTNLQQQKNMGGWSVHHLILWCVLPIPEIPNPKAFCIENVATQRWLIKNITGFYLTLWLVILELGYPCEIWLDIDIVAKVMNESSSSSYEWRFLNERARIPLIPRTPGGSG